MRHQGFIRNLLLLATLLVASAAIQARTVTVNVSSIAKGSNLATALNNQIQRLTYDDTFAINFDQPGTYVLDDVIIGKCSVTMTGTGTDNTIILLKKNESQKKLNSDAFITIAGTPTNPISVTIRDLSINLMEHQGIWWENSEFHAVKIYHAGKVDLRNVKSTMLNAKITNFDLRVCSNVTVENCVISNYNNCSTGGNLWLRGEMHNITIRNNKFYKYGNDEAVAFFSKTINAKNSAPGNISRTNIRVTDNEFYYQHNDKLIDGMFNDMIFSVLTSDHYPEYSCDMRGFELARNKFYVNDLCKRIIHFQFDTKDRHSDFVIHDNEFISNNVKSGETFYRMDIDVWDLSTQQDTIVVRNNTMTNKYAIMNPYNGSGYTFLLVRSGNLLLDGNKVNNLISTGPNRKSYGVNLLWCGKEGGTVTLRNNVCKGLARIATLESGNGIGQFSLTAFNNYFQGRTTIYCKKIDRLDLDFRNNTFDCNHDYFFLEDFASKGNVIFNNNKVTVTTRNGQFMAHYGNASTSSMRFEKLEIRGNEFRGVNSQNDMLKHISNVRKRKVKSNSFYPR